MFIGSKVTKTEHSRILKIQEKSINYKKLITLLKQLDNFCKTRNINKINDCLKNISNDLKFNEIILSLNIRKKLKNYLCIQ